MELGVNVRLLDSDKFEVNTQATKARFYIGKKRKGMVSQGSNSLELFFYSLGSCIVFYVRKYLEDIRIVFENLNMVLSAELSQVVSLRLVNIKAEILTDAELNVRKDVFLRFIKNCPIHNTIVHTEGVNISLR
ncbi:MAG: OsmC family protein [Candidatus Saelkia tenebricola]|nr:OsmC family protein [Candidatus Saelkia tenebricola]